MSGAQSVDKFRVAAAAAHSSDRKYCQEEPDGVSRREAGLRRCGAVRVNGIDERLIGGLEFLLVQTENLENLIGPVECIGFQVQFPVAYLGNFLGFLKLEHQLFPLSKECKADVSHQSRALFSGLIGFRLVM